VLIENLLDIKSKIKKIMSEIINNSDYRKKSLKELILKLHRGEDPVQIRKELISSLSKIPYGEVVEVEQELIGEGLPVEEVLKLCDVHGEVLKGHIDRSAESEIPEGHPADIFIKENRELLKVVQKTREALDRLVEITDKEFREYVFNLLGLFNQLYDVDKHYKRKEYLLFPFLEKREITGPPRVMWGKHDEIREQLKGCIEVLRTDGLTKQDLSDTINLLFIPALKAVEEMVSKEEEILIPMSLDTLTTEEWWTIHQQTPEFGFTLYDPQTEWRPEGLKEEQITKDISIVESPEFIRLPSGSFTVKELTAILNTVPVDMTFVDRDDKVKYFTQGKHRIFPRNRSIINRDVRLCHPPGSVHIVEKILEDFKTGRASHAPFWIQIQGKFILIEYFALRDEEGNYLGTLEVSQDITNARKLEGEQRILSYADEK